MAASTVVHELAYQGIIPDDIKARVLTTMSARQQNDILHNHLLETSTSESFLTTCDIIIQIQGNPRMRALGEEMKKELETGNCVYLYDIHLSG